MRDFGRTGGSPAQRVRGGQADRHLRDYRQNIGSESKGRQVDRDLREYGRTGELPSQRVLADGLIAISESTADRQITG